jgi:hypothetical protein
MLGGNMMQFNEFVNHKERESRRHLKIIKKVLETAKPSFKVKSFMDDEDQYIFVYAPDENFTFEGIRIYPIGDGYAYKIQNTENTHPFGMAYGLNIEKMFSDHMSDEANAKDAAKNVADDIRREIRKFFELTGEAEQDIAGSKIDSGDKYLLKTGGTDYSSLIFNKM